MYQLIQNRKGNRYMKDGKFVSANAVPELWQRILNNQDIFTGEPATHKRLIANVMLPLSDESYYNQTVGSLTAKLREGEQDNGSDEEIPE